MHQEDPNSLTIQTYNQHVEAYTKTTPSKTEQSDPVMLQWIDASLQLVPSDGTILEIGSAMPRDARYIRSKGFAVTCSDASIGFVESLCEQNEPALLFNAITDPFPGRYHMIFANAVVPHFTLDDFEKVLSKVHSALYRHGIFSFSAKQGVGETWVEEKFEGKRFVRYWQLNALTELLDKHGFEIVFTSQNIGNLPQHVWINIVARKQA